ncbi:MAG: hypothetical protein ACLP19_17810 [Xanthobacteraceae bacterium]
MLRKLVCAGAIVPLITGAAAAQDLSIPFKPKTPPPSQEQIERQKAADKAYDAAIHKIPDKKSPPDPWGDVRPAKSKQQ